MGENSGRKQSPFYVTANMNDVTPQQNGAHHAKEQPHGSFFKSTPPLDAMSSKSANSLPQNRYVESKPPNLAEPLTGFPTSTLVNSSRNLAPPNGSVNSTGSGTVAMRLARPGMMRYHSSPSVPTLSPTRHHFRLPNLTPREIRETLNAKYRENEGRRQLNQYTLKESIGKGTFGEVYLAVDETTGVQYAVKEYSKSRLLKLNRTELLQRRKVSGRGKSAFQLEQEQEFSNPLNLIRREIAIMKKLDHPNIVNLIEVLDDPHGDSLFMILEWCEKGVIMPSEPNPGRGSPYSEEQCRLYFRDMILGIEYLHSQGIIHRDIKSDNVLLSEDDVVKIVDFGVSEMFDTENDVIKKKAGSPAYMAPELAVVSSSFRATPQAIPHSTVSGRAADIWAMGVTLYYICFGQLPFQADTMVELFEKIILSDPGIPEQASDDLRDLLRRILEKNPRQRIRMPELRCHPWVTRRDEDPLLITEENIADSISPVTEEDLLTAIERIQGVMDAGQAAEKLRKLHGWRGTLDSSSSISSRESSISPDMRASEGPGFDERFGMFKLTWALDEIINRGGVKSASMVATTPVPMEPEPIRLDDPGSMCPSAPEGVAENLNLTSAPNGASKAVDEEGPSLTVERRNSRSRQRKHLGLDMTASRSRSLDVDDRI